MSRRISQTIFRKYLKKSRYLLNKGRDKLTDDEMERLVRMFNIAPRLADAYRVKNEFLEVMCSESSTVGRKMLVDWLFGVELMELK